jgi:hypothetical protein
MRFPLALGVAPLILSWPRPAHWGSPSQRV